MAEGRPRARVLFVTAGVRAIGRLAGVSVSAAAVHCMLAVQRRDRGILPACHTGVYLLLVKVRLSTDEHETTRTAAPAVPRDIQKTSTYVDETMFELFVFWAPPQDEWLHLQQEEDEEADEAKAAGEQIDWIFNAACSLSCILFRGNYGTKSRHITRLLFQDPVKFSFNRRLLVSPQLAQ